jgi:hypothetical protein
MLIVGAVGLSLGIIAARFFKVFVLFPAIIGAGAIAAITRIFFGDGLASAIATALTIAITFQTGFFAHLIFRRYVGESVNASEQPTPRTSPDFGPPLFETHDVDKALQALTEKLTEMRAPTQGPRRIEKQQARQGRKG